MKYKNDISLHKKKVFDNVYIYKKKSFLNLFPTALLFKNKTCLFAVFFP